MKKKLADEIGKAYVRLHCSHPKNKGDLIGRQAVLDELEKWDWQDLYLPIHFKQILDDIPSADVRPNIHGHWKVVSDGYGDNAYICECSECKDTVWVYKDADRKWNYCPNCGADMRGERYVK